MFSSLIKATQSQAHYWQQARKESITHSIPFRSGNSKGARSVNLDLCLNTQTDIQKERERE